MRSGLLRLLAVAAVALLVLPLIALAVRAPWTVLLAALGREDLLGALVRSLTTAAAAAAVAVVVGVPLGWCLARRDRWRVVRPLVLAPLVLPPTVVGAGLDDLLGPAGLLGVDRSAGLLALVLAQVVVALPFAVLAAETAIRRADPRAEETAVLHGMAPGTVLRRVTLPSARTGILAGAALAWARALGELGAVVVLAGDGGIPDGAQVLPSVVALQLRSDPAAAHAAGLIMVAVCLAVVIGLRDRVVLGVRPRPRRGAATDPDIGGSLAASSTAVSP